MGSDNCKNCGRETSTLIENCLYCFKPSGVCVSLEVRDKIKKALEAVLESEHFRDYQRACSDAAESGE